jgi:hypothetical protein
MHGFIRSFSPKLSPTAELQVACALFSVGNKRLVPGQGRVNLRGREGIQHATEENLCRKCSGTLDFGHSIGNKGPRDKSLTKERDNLKVASSSRLVRDLNRG